MKSYWKKANKTLLALFLAGVCPFQATGQDAAVYVVDAEASRADILVFKAGKLSRFGHDHVISTTTIRGMVTVPPDFTGSTAELVVPLDSLVVDRDDLREKYGMVTELSGSAKKGTRANMLDKVLESSEWPQVVISAAMTSMVSQEAILNVSVALHGVKKEIELPVSLLINDERLKIQGVFELLQTDYGIKPFSRMGGALRIKDGIKIHFDILANRQHPDDNPEEHSGG